MKPRSEKQQDALKTLKGYYETKSPKLRRPCILCDLIRQGYPIASSPGYTCERCAWVIMTGKKCAEIDTSIAIKRTDIDRFETFRQQRIAELTEWIQIWEDSI